MSRDLILTPEPSPREGEIEKASELLQEDRERAQEVRRRVRAPATLAAYDKAWRAFVAWCEKRELPPLSAGPEDVSAYLTWLSEQRPTPVHLRRQGGLSRPRGGRKMRLSTILTAYSAIAMVFRGNEISGWETSKACPTVVRHQLDALRRTIGTAPMEQKEAVTLEDLRALVGALGDELPGVRDKAIILVDFFACNRRAETAAIEVADLKFAVDGFTLRLPQSKTDQEGEGFVKGVTTAEREPAMCPVAALKRWLELSGITEGPVFRGVRHGADGNWRVVNKRISGAMVAGIVKRSASTAGFDEARIARLSSHSLRAGFITICARLGVDAVTISKQSGHKDLNTLRGYIRDATVFEKNPGKGLV